MIKPARFQYYADGVARLLTLQASLLLLWGPARQPLGEVHLMAWEVFVYECLLLMLFWGFFMNKNLSYDTHCSLNASIGYSFANARKARHTFDSF